MDPATWTPIWPKFESSAEGAAKDYAELRDGLTNSVPEGWMREAALKGIEILDCGNPDKTSCDPDTKPPPEVSDWRDRLARACVGHAAFAKALATELRSLVCANNDNAIHILRGISETNRLRETDREAPRLVDFIMSKTCPVSASLTDADRAKLLKIKQDAEKEFPPPSKSKKEK